MSRDLSRKLQGDVRLLGSEAEKGYATKSRREEAKDRLDDFVAVQDSSITFDDLCEADVCEVQYWQGLAGYLVEHAENRRTGDGLAMNYILDLLSAAHMVARQKFPRNDFIQEIEPQWMTDIRCAVEREKGLDAIRTGTKLTSKAPAIYRPLMLQLCRQLLKEGEPAEKRIVLAKRIDKTADYIGYMSWINDDIHKIGLRIETQLQTWLNEGRQRKCSITCSSVYDYSLPKLRKKMSDGGTAAGSGEEAGGEETGDNGDVADDGATAAGGSGSAGGSSSSNSWFVQKFFAGN